MAIYTSTEIEQGVRTLLDERDLNTALFDDELRNELSSLIQGLILEGVARVHKSAPYYMLNTDGDFGVSLEDSGMSNSLVFWDNTENYGHILLPEDFMRLLVFQMSDWDKAVYSAITPSDPQYALQRRGIAGLRGTPQHPVCALVIYPEGKALEFYSCKSRNETIYQALYIPYPTFDENNGVNIAPQCYQSVLYMICSLVCNSLGRNEQANIFATLSNSSLK